MIIALQVVLLFLMAASVVFYSWCAICTSRFRTDSQKDIGTSGQSVSVLIPVCGVDEFALDNWVSFCQQDYEHYEVLFGVMNPEDEAVVLLKELVARFPDTAKLIFCLEARGVNHQVSNLMHLIEAARHEVVILTDSDMRVTPDYLRTVTAPLADPSIGLVTCGYVGHNPKFLGAALASLGRCVDFIPSVLVARSLDKELRFALGATLATRKSVLDKFGGLQNVVNRIGSDFHIGKLTKAAGYRIELSDYILETDGGRETIWQVFRREWRWARAIRFNRGPQYYGLGLSYGTVYCVPLLLVSGFANWAIIACLTTLSVRVIQALVAIYRLDCPNLLRWIWALPIRDLMSFTVWVAGAFGQRIYWRGRWLQIGAGGILTQVEPESPGSSAIDQRLVP